MENNAPIQEFYNSTRVEETRLDEDVSMLEKVRTQEVIERYLHGEMTIADIGGATGAYSFWLRDKGHAVHLLDASAIHIELANKKASEEHKPLASVAQGDARSLPYEDETFDMVLLMGPLYHLHNAGERIQTIREAHRVLKKGGVVIAASITRYASLLDGFWRNFVSDPIFEGIMKNDLVDGRHMNPTDDPRYFTTAFFHTQKELESEFTSVFTSPLVVAVEGFGWLLPDFMKQWNNTESRARLLQYIRQTETDQVMIGISAHQLTIAKKATERNTDVKF